MVKIYQMFAIFCRLTEETDCNLSMSHRWRLHAVVEVCGRAEVFLHVGIITMLTGGYWHCMSCCEYESFSVLRGH